jgi:hypothetical protein
MLHHPLKQLVKDVRRDRKEDVSKWEPFPEWMENGFQASIPARKVKRADIAISQSISVKGSRLDAGRKDLVFAKLAQGNFTFRAAAVIRTGHKGLFRVVSDEHS